MSRAPQRASGPRLPRRSRAGFRLAFTIAARNARRSAGRTLLIALLIALPVAGMVGAATVGLSMVGSPAQVAQAHLGRHMAASFEVNPYRVHQEADSSYPDGGSEIPLVEPSTWLPSHWRLVPITPTAVYLRTAHGVAMLPAVAGRTWDAALEGRYDLLSGRPPTGADEILASPAALRRLGVEVGGRVRTADLTRSYRVVGTLRDLTAADSQPMVFGVANGFPGMGTDPTGTTFYLDGPPVTSADIQAFNRHGAFVQSRAATAALVSIDPFSATNSLTWSYAALIGIAGGFLLFEVALLAGAGFLVGARQQQRALAVLASVGADRRLLSRSVAAGGVVTGAAGALAGIALGVGGAAVAMALTRNGSSTQFYGFVVHPVVLVAIALVAIAAAWVAAAAPGRAASRFDIVAALRGARRPPRPSRLAPALGGVVMIVGAGIAVAGGILTFAINGRNPQQLPNLDWLGPTAIVVGSIVLQLGAMLGVPLLLRLVARVGARGVGSRMATRDLARNSARAVPAVAAVMSTVFVAAFAMVAVAGGERQAELTYEYRAPMNTAMLQFETPVPTRTVDDPEAYRAALARLLPVRDARVIRGAPDAQAAQESDGSAARDVPALPAPRTDASARCAYTEGSTPCHAPGFLSSGGWGAHIVVGDRDDLAAILGARPSEAATQALAQGDAVAFYPEYLARGRVTIDWWTQKQLTAGDEMRPDGGDPDRSITLPAVLDHPPHPNAFGIMLSPETAKRLGIPVQPRLVLATLTATPTPDQRDALDAFLAARGTATQQPAYLNVEQGPARFAGGVAWIILGIAGLITLAASAIALGLARIDARRDEQTLGAVGAPPRTLRSIAFWQTLVLAGLGSVIGGALALVPGFALSISGTLAFAPPWLQLAATAVAVPLLIATVTAVTRRVHRPTFVDRAAIG